MGFMGGIFTMGFMGGFSMMKNGGLRIVLTHTHRIHGAGMYANIKGVY
jgi:hypothetical protein